MISSIASQVFKLEKIFYPLTLDETPNLFQSWEKVKIKTQKQKLFEEINTRLNHIRGKGSINVFNKEDVAQFLEDFENF